MLRSSATSKTEKIYDFTWCARGSLVYAKTGTCVLFRLQVDARAAKNIIPASRFDETLGGSFILLCMFVCVCLVRVRRLVYFSLSPLNFFPRKQTIREGTGMAVHFHFGAQTRVQRLVSRDMSCLG